MNRLRGLLKLSLLVGLAAICVLNTLPYLKFAERVWSSAAMQGQMDGMMFALVFVEGQEIGWMILGLALWLNLQLLELLPNIKNTKIPRKYVRQVRLAAYAADLAIVLYVYPVRAFPPDWMNVALVLFALFAVEAVAYVAEKV